MSLAEMTPTRGYFGRRRTDRRVLRPRHRVEDNVFVAKTRRGRKKSAVSATEKTLCRARRHSHAITAVWESSLIDGKYIADAGERC
uniref:DUF1534 domain-containing protein n=1 Tax=Steinernema glaseri TaxID=37863 RepID=A0A1I7YCE4_9BILA